MSLLHDERELKYLPLAVLDLPELDARIARDPIQMDELTSDIAKRGVILPLAVVRTGDRYEIVDGTSRFLAAARAGLAAVPCTIYPSKDVALEGVKYAANLFRLDMTPAEEAKFLHELLYHECGEDFEKLCALVNRGATYVNNRLELLAGDEDVFEAVRLDQISLGVAALLNSIGKEDYRRYYLRLAIRDGWTVAMATSAVSEWKKLYEGMRVDAPATPAPSGAVIVSTYDPHHCVVCRKTDPRYIPEQVSVHTHCKLAVLEPLLDSYHGTPARQE